MGLGVGDILRVSAKMVHASSGTRTLGVYHWSVSDLVSDVFADVKSDISARLQQLYTAMTLYFQPDAQADGYKMVNVTKKETYGEGTWTFVGTAPGADEVPPQCAALVQVYTADAGRYGRKYIGPLDEASIQDGRWLPGVITAAGNFADLWSATFVGAVTGNTYLSGVARKVNDLWVFKQFATALGKKVINAARTLRSRTAGFGLT